MRHELQRALEEVRATGDEKLGEATTVINGLNAAARKKDHDFKRTTADIEALEAKVASKQGWCDELLRYAILSGLALPRHLRLYFLRFFSVSSCPFLGTPSSSWTQIRLLVLHPILIHLCRVLIFYTAGKNGASMRN